MLGPRDPILEFWDPLISRERLELEISNLARRRRSMSSNRKNVKLGQKGSCGGHLIHFWNFGTLLIFPERLKLETSNLVRRRMSVTSNEKNAKLGQKGSGWGHVTHFWNFGTPTPNISGTVEARNFKFGTETEGGEF